MFSGKIPYPQKEGAQGAKAKMSEVGPLTRQRLNIDGVTIITGGGRERCRAAAALHGETFKTDPAITFLMHDWRKEDRLAYLPDYFVTLMTAAAMNDAVFDEAWISGPSEDRLAPPTCSAVWVLPGRKIDSLKSYTSSSMFHMLFKVGFTGIKRMLVDFQVHANRAKKKGLGKNDGSGQLVQAYYLFFISTASEARGQGLGGKLITRFQDEVRNEGKGTPIWLEATTEGSMRLYERCGFEHVTDWRLGEGIVDKDGEATKGGEGVKLWAMVWWPDKKKFYADDE